MDAPFNTHNLSALLANMAGSSDFTVQRITDAHPAVVAELKSCHPVKTASIFSALLTEPKLQASCLFLEALIALSLVHCAGTRKPTMKEVRRWFKCLNDGPCGMMVDPSEDVFTNTICLEDGEYGLFEGIWEGASFYTQLCVQFISFSGRNEALESVRRSVIGLLKLSSELIRRRKLARHEYGASEPVRELSAGFAEWGRRNRQVVSFSLSDIEALGVELEDLAVFGFLPEFREDLAHSALGHSPLDRYPLAYRNDEVIVLAPTAVSSAIRLYVMEFFLANDAVEDASGLLAYAYRDLYERVGILGSRRGPDLEFEKSDSGFYSSVVKQIDVGRYLNFVFLVDAFDGFETGGLVGLSNDPHRFDEEIDACIDHAYELVSNTPNFRGMTTLTVGCGIGRAISYIGTEKHRDNWRHRHLSAYDLFVISQTEAANPLLIWQLLDAEQAVRSNGVSLHNINGLINLLAWSQSLDGHLIPHERMPDDFFGDNVFLVVDQNAQKQLRYDVAVRTDRRLLKSPHGEMFEVRKLSESQFPGDDQIPLYAFEGILDGRGMPLAYVAQDRVWWGEVDTPTATKGSDSYARWQLIKTWLPRIADTLSQYLPELASNCLLHTKYIANIGDGGSFDGQGSYQGSLQSISFSLDKTKNAVLLEIGEGFEHGIFNAENVAERALVTRAVEGFFGLCQKPLPPEFLDKVVSEIVPNADARQAHRYTSTNVRDILRSTLPDRLVKTHPLDEGVLKLGLGWRFRDRSEGAIVEGVGPCTSLLNAVIAELTNDLRTEIARYSKAALLKMCLINHEVAAAERQQWRTTSRAMLALRDQAPEALETIIQHEFELNGIFASSRNIAEIAVCEANNDGGLVPGRLDLARMQARAMLIFHLGNHSNAIRWGAMEPKIRITPQGDIHANHDFTDQVVQPYAQAGTSSSIDEDIKKYPERIVQDLTPNSSSETGLDPDFEEAFAEEMGGTIYQLRILVESIEDRAVIQEVPIISAKLSELCELSTDTGELSPAIARSLIEKLILSPRKTWDTIPSDCQDKDIRFWRFRRQLSLVRRPFLALSNDDDPVVLVSPGMLRESLVYILGNYHSGSFPIEQIQSPKMRQHKAKTDDARGNAFELKVKARFDQLGWDTFHGRSLPEILGGPLDRNYGDVDVLAVSPDKKRILVIECKDLLERKTPGEIAEQVSKFQGSSEAGKKDLLQKHLDRVHELQERPEKVIQFCGAGQSASIEGWLIFSKVVPMQWAWSELQSKSRIATLDDVDHKF